MAKSRSIISSFSALGVPTPKAKFYPVKEEPKENQLPPIDRHGSCPNCEKGWDGGDILEELGKLDVFKGSKSPQQLMQIAALYGYTETNRTRFTKLLTREFPQYNSRAFWQCPHCFHVWDKQTNFHYINLNQALGKSDTNQLPF